MLMAQKLEVPTCLERLNRIGQQILLSLRDGQLPLEQVVALADVDQSEALSTITRLIENGYLELLILEYPWGIEFDLQAKGQVSR
jgi:hypothetical protein